jgi:tetratricopeptide (TPR) repeat protein
MNVDILTQILSFYDAITNYNVYSKVNKEWRKASLLVLMNPENLLTEEFEHDHAIELKNEGNIYFKDKEYKKAIASYTYSLAFDDKLLETFTNRTVAYLHIADYQNAYNDAMHVTKIAPDNFKGWYRMAIVLKFLELLPC